MQQDDNSDFFFTLFTTWEFMCLIECDLICRSVNTSSTTKCSKNVPMEIAICHLLVFYFFLYFNNTLEWVIISLFDVASSNPGNYTSVSDLSFLLQTSSNLLLPAPSSLSPHSKLSLPNTLSTPLNPLYSFSGKSGMFLSLYDYSL